MKSVPVWSNQLPGVIESFYFLQSFLSFLNHNEERLWAIVARFKRRNATRNEVPYPHGLRRQLRWAFYYAKRVA